MQVISSASVSAAYLAVELATAPPSRLARRACDAGQTMRMLMQRSEDRCDSFGSSQEEELEQGLKVGGRWIG